MDDALIAVEPDHKMKTNFGRDVKHDLPTRELECKQLYFPRSEILNSDNWEEALQEYTPDQFNQYMKFRREILSAFRNYQLHIIELKKEISKEAVCLVFGKVNTGGVSLSVFELVTASYAADGYNLRDDWYGSTLRKVSSRSDRLAKEPMLQVVEATDFLRAITMLHTLERRRTDIAAGNEGKQAAAVSAKQAAILSLPLDAYRKWDTLVEAGFMVAAKFLRKECFTNPRDLPYRTQLAPLAAVMAMIPARWLEPQIYEKLSRWYWCGVLGELYGGAVETRVANDVEDLLKWIEQDDDQPRTIIKSAFQPDRLNRLTSRLSAAYKGINVLILRDGARDFFWKANIRELDAEEVDLDIHHIFPQDWCEKQKIPRKHYNAIVNKTPISYKANSMVGGVTPSQYLQKLQDHKQVRLDDQGMNAILESHLIQPNALRTDNFQDFYQVRKQAMLTIIERAMGKSVVASSLTDDTEIDDDAINEGTQAFQHAN